MINTNHKNSNCHGPENRATEYCRKLKSGIVRLKAAIQAQYENTFPDHRDSLERALAEAEASAWATPFPALFFPALARLRISKIAAEPMSADRS